MASDLTKIVTAIQAMRQCGNFKAALDAFPADWEGASNFEHKAVLAKERGICHFYLEEYWESCKYIQMAYELLQHVDSSDDYLEIVNSYAWFLMEAGNPAAVGAILKSVRDEFEVDEKKRNTTLKGSIGAYMYWQWGTAECRLEHYDPGTALLEHSIAIFQGLDDPASREQWCVVLELAEIYLMRRDNNHDRSQHQRFVREWLDRFGRVLSGFSEEEYPNRLAAEWHKCWALWHMNEGDLDQAEKEIEQAQRCAERSQVKRMETACALVAGQLKKVRGLLTVEERARIVKECLRSKEARLISAAMEL